MTGKIQGGLYLVVDPIPGLQAIYSKINAALQGGVDVIQLWDNWNPHHSQEELITVICHLAHKHQVPVLINNHWQWLETLPLDGVHFDEIPAKLSEVKQKIGRHFVIGLTCDNDQERIDWAINNKLDYISFCSMFPSTTSDSCELVQHDSIKQARKKTRMPIFVSGGITFDNLPSLFSLGINGTAIVSGIMKAEDQQLAARTFKEILRKSITE